MARFTSIIFGLVGYLVVASCAAPTSSDFGIGDILNLLKLGLVTKINAIITTDSFITNEISINFDIKNPLILDLTIDSIASQAGLNGTVYSTFNHTFTPPLVVPILGSINSGNISHVSLVKGLTGSLDIIPYGVLDLISTDVNIRVLGIPIPITGLKQDGVPTTYDLSVS
ncbi:hypothetical protein BDN72DRAFT_896766 [Pluteus cervinus]|uniref:Uncharacterized protein n=1 Tax=Pluteus cervinus TaxID=181527 RepID=A0ACD3AWS6_9AGAR|nr:hypothetical protein BDN72DRAFT_896766 [Pluteus cervinus]